MSHHSQFQLTEKSSNPSGLQHLVWLTWFIFACCCSLWGQSPDDTPRFKNIGLTEGLSQSTVFAILQDHVGFMWFGTFTGLNRYDGNRFEVFRKDPDNPNSLPDDIITNLYEDQLGQLWVGTRNGLCRWVNRDTSQSRFHRYFHDPDNPRTLSDNTILDILEDSTGQIWITCANGLNRYDPATDEFERIVFNPNAAVTLAGRTIYDTANDRQDNLWIATDGGLTLIPPDRKRSVHLAKLPTKGAISLSHETLKALKGILQEKPRVKLGPSSSIGEALRATWRLDRPTKVLVLGLGERVDQTWLDFGEIRQNGHLIWDMRVGDDRFAGGHQRNRLVATTLFLDAGEYEVVYHTNRSHHPGAWEFLPPNQPNWWGIRIHDLSHDPTVNLDRYLADVQSPSPNLANTPWRVTIDRFDRLWIGLRETGLIRFEQLPVETMTDQKPLPAITRDPAGDIAGLAIQDFWEDREGTLWIATYHGLVQYQPARQTARLYSQDPYDSRSLATNEINAVFRDRGNNLWIGSVLNGIDLWPANTTVFEHFRKIPDRGDALPSNQVYGFAQIDEELYWIATRLGLGLFDRNKRMFLETSAGLSPLESYTIMTICDAGQGRFLVGAAQGLYQLDISLRPASSKPKVQVDRVQAIPLNGATDRNIRVIRRGPDGRFWIGTFLDGLFALDLDGQTLVGHWPANTGKGGLPNPHVSSIFFDQHRQLWVGTFGGGLARYQPTTNQFLIFHHDMHREDSLSHNTVTSFLDGPNGRLWAGTYGGGINIQLDGQDVWQRITTADGLPDNVVYGMLMDDQRTVWASTNRGLVQIELQDGRFTFRSFDISDGLQSQEFHRGSYYRDSEGHFFFGGTNGFNAFKPKTGQDSLVHHPILFRDIQVMGESASFDQATHQVKQLNLKPGRYTLAFTWTALDFERQRSLDYRLYGIDKRWRQTDQAVSPIYSLLKPGSYRFQVRHRGTYAKDVASTNEFVVNIAPLLHQRTWFRALLLGLTIALAIGLYRWRIWYLQLQQRRQQAFTRDLMTSLEKDRARIAAGLHDGLGQDLLVINSALQAKSQTAPRPEAESLRELSEKLRQSIDEVRRIAYNLRPHHLDKLGLRGAIKALVENLEQAADLRVFLEWPNTLSVLQEEQEIQLYRIVQEATTNILRHAEATVVRISLQTNTRTIRLEISDNGRGMPTGAGRRRGLGLRTMRERARFLQGELQVQSQPGRGSLIQLTIPVMSEDS